MKQKPFLLLLIAYIAFVSLGLPDGLLGVAWPSIRTDFRLPISELGLLLAAFVVGYMSSSFTSGQIIARFGIGGLLVGSSILMTISLLGYVAAAHWWLIIGCGVLSGLGAGAIDAGLNGYAAAHFGPRHVNWLHACYGLGAMLGPLLMTAVLSNALSWRWGYGLVGGILLLMTAAFIGTRRLWQSDRAADAVAASAPAEPAVAMSAALRRPLIWVSMALFFIYTGLEVTAGQWAYSLFTEGRGIAPQVGGVWVGIYWGSLTVGRVIFGLAAERLGATAILRASMIGVPAGALLLWLNITPLLSFIGLASIGFLLAPIFPLLIAQTPARLGPSYAAHAIGFQVSAANLGSVLIPGLAGILAQEIAMEAIGPLLLVVALLLLLLHEVLLRPERASQRVLMQRQAR